jgi:hypothetical protein
MGIVQSWGFRAILWLFAGLAAAVAPEALALPLTPGNVLVATQTAVQEYTRQGAFVQEFAIPGVSQPMSGLAVLENGSVAMISGQSSPRLSILNPNSGGWRRSATVPGWNLTPSGGHLVAIGNDVLVTDADDVPTRQRGLIRFDSVDFSYERALDDVIGDLAHASDGFIYAELAHRTAGVIQVLDPSSLQVLREISLGSMFTTLAVASDGSIAASRQNRTIHRYDSQGFFISGLSLPVSATDTEFARDDTLFIALRTGADQVEVFSSDLYFSHVERFLASSPGTKPYLALVPVPEPSTFLLVAVGLLFAGCRPTSR